MVQLHMLIHTLSKEARRRIIEEAVKEYGKKELAEMLGVSKAAISKYLSEKTHPSDEVLRKLFRVCDEKLKKKLILIVIDELASVIEELRNEILNTDLDSNIIEAMLMLKEKLYELPIEDKYEGEKTSIS